jgi:hypothetical protein
LSRIFDAVRSADRSFITRARSSASDRTPGVPATPAAPGAGGAPSVLSVSNPHPSSVPVDDPAKSTHPAHHTTPSAAPNPILAGAFAVVGVAWEAAGPDRNPRLRLAEALKKQLTRVNFRHTNMRPAIVYGNDQTDTHTLPALRKKYRANGRFCEFLFFGETSRAACKQFGIRLKILDMAEEDAIPGRRVTVIREPYFPGV